MKFQKIVHLLDTTSDDKDLPRFVTTKWIEVHDQSEKYYDVNKEIRIKTPMLRSDLCDFSDAGLQISVSHRTMTDRNKCLTDLKLFQSDIVSERKIKT